MFYERDFFCLQDSVALIKSKFYCNFLTKKNFSIRGLEAKKKFIYEIVMNRQHIFEHIAVKQRDMDANYFSFTYFRRDVFKEL